MAKLHMLCGPVGSGKTTYGRAFATKHGSPGPKPKYLLTGFAKCSECGGPMQVTNG